MADYVTLELKTFELSNRNSELSLSMTSLAYIKDLPFSQSSSPDLHHLIQSKQLWLLSPGFCQLQIAVDQSQFPERAPDTEFEFLNYLADAICQCSLWASLGLLIEKEDIHYHSEYDNGPNLYFVVHHPNKSSALLSPPGTPTAQFTGLECLFRFRFGTHEASHDNSPDFNAEDMETTDNLSTNTVREPVLNPFSHPSPALHSSDPWAGPAEDIGGNDMQELWQDAAYLAQAAMPIVIGAKKRVPGLQLFELGTSPSLLDLAPAVWNAHYLKAAAINARNFPTISRILEASLEGQSPSLREKGAKLLENNAPEDKPENNQGVNRGPAADAMGRRTSIQRRLWDLLQATLTPTTHIRNAKRSIVPLPTPQNIEMLEYMPFEEDGLEGYEYEDPDAAEDIDRSDADSESSPNADWRLRQVSESEAYDGSGQLDAIENQQWWGCETADMDIDSDVTLERRDTVEETEGLLYRHEGSTPGQYFPSSDETYDTSTLFGDTEPSIIYDDFRGDAMDIEDTYASSHCIYDEADYDAHDTQRFDTESSSLYEAQYESLHECNDNNMPIDEGLVEDELGVHEEQTDYAS
ncbi:hypothetical protein F5B20DRAFT_594407 [Whalleya microplaca]|nr:hypothetical protein F5B20DRAFT_594407 [Whalleya microplaca]